MTQAEQGQIRMHCGGTGRVYRRCASVTLSKKKKQQHKNRGERTVDGKKTKITTKPVSIHFPQFSAEQHRSERCLFLL